jgi:choline dehydrogenase-like flavoprotein
MQVDVCIVGSGPAGAILANELAGTGKRIAIVEAGAWHDQAEQTKRLAEGDAAMVAIAKPHLHVPISIRSNTKWTYWQIKKVGGNSRLWGGWTPRGLEHQFKMRSVHGLGVDWPIEYAELEPYYCRAEEELGVSGDVTTPWRSRAYPLPPILRDHAGQLFASACERVGFECETVQVARALEPYKGRDACRYCNVVNCTNCPTSARYKSDIHVKQAVARDVVLLTETTAQRLVLGDHGRIVELQCSMPDRSRKAITADVFVLAGNSVGTARLLLMSGVANRSDAVGRHYMGHPVYDYQAQLKTKVLAARSGYTVVSRHFETGEHLREAAGFRMLFNGADRSPTVHGLRLLEQGLYGTRWKQAFKQRVGNGVKATIVTDCLPRPENRVELDPEHRDYFGDPGLRINYNYSEYEDNGRALGERSMARVLEVLEATEAVESTHDMAHQLGTTRMGTDPATSVVNRNLRAHDVDNLYIVGGSVFPNGLGATNPTLTVAALSLRLAGHLRESS